MRNPLPFNTKKYAIILSGNKIEKSDVFAEALSEAMDENLYPKNEIDNMLEKKESQINTRFDQVDQQLVNINQKFEQVDQKFKHFEEKMDYRFENFELKLQLNFQKAIHAASQKTIFLLGSLIVVVGVISTFAHSFFH